MKVRVKFAKFGVMKFIGHLDVMRFFQKAIRRAGIDIAYTEGFSPHQIMSFAAPLGVGLCSEGEYMDIEIRSHNGAEDMLRRLNAACVPGIEVLSVKALPEGAGNAMASVAAAGYEAVYRDGERSFLAFSDKLRAFVSQERIPVVKETKRGHAEIDLKPGIYELRVTQEGAVYMLVDASSSGNIKPSLLLDAFYGYAGLQPEPFALQLTRKETYTNLGTDDARQLVPLEDVGVAF